MIKIIVIVAVALALVAVVLWAFGRVGEDLDRFANESDGEWLS